MLEDWHTACIGPLYKGKRDRGECLNCKGIHLLRVSGMLYGRIAIERMKACKYTQPQEFATTYLVCLCHLSCNTVWGRSKGTWNIVE